MRKRLGWLFCGVLVAGGCGEGGPLGDMARGETGRVVRVIDGDALVLDTGQSVRLVGIEAPPMNWRTKEPAPYAEKASRALEDIVMGREVRLYYPGLTRDRYDRALAHAETADAKGGAYWVNLELVRQGAARVRMYPDTSGGGAALMAAEAEARADRAGLWALNAYQPVEAQRMPGDARGFMLVRGTIGEPREAGIDAVPETSCLLALEGAALTVRVLRTSAESCETKRGTAVELRGWVSEGELELNHPLHLTVLPG